MVDNSRTSLWWPRSHGFLPSPLIAWHPWNERRSKRRPYHHKEAVDQSPTAAHKRKDRRLPHDTRKTWRQRRCIGNGGRSKKNNAVTGELFQKTSAAREIGHVAFFLPPYVAVAHRELASKETSAPRRVRKQYNSGQQNCRATCAPGRTAVDISARVWCLGRGRRVLPMK